MSDQRWARGLVIGGLILLVLAIADPLEGSLLTVPGIAAVTVGAFLTQSRFRVRAYWGSALLVLGVSAMWILSAFGGIGGDTGRSMWWALLLLPYPIGWLLGLLAGIRMLRDVFRPAARR